MNFQNLCDTSLDHEMVASVKNETRTTLRVLHLLREVDRRRLYSKLKYQSLVDYAVQRLGYPYDQAWRRIDAMRLLKEMPEIEEKIASGSLNLTNIGYAHAAFKAEAKKIAPLSKEEKLEFLSRIENKSTRETQKIVAEEFGKEVLIRETVKPVTATVSMLNLPVTDDLLADVEDLKGLLAHSHPGLSTTDLFRLMAKEKLAALRTKREGIQKKQKVTPFAAPRKCDDGVRTKDVETRYVAASVNRKLWLRDQSSCRNCGSKYAIQRDHKVPFGKNGKTNLDNLRLLCRSCNQRAAIEQYGLNKMSKFFSANKRDSAEARQR